MDLEMDLISNRRETRELWLQLEAVVNQVDLITSKTNKMAPFHFPKSAWMLDQASKAHKVEGIKRLTILMESVVEKRQLSDKLRH